MTTQEACKAILQTMDEKGTDIWCKERYAKDGELTAVVWAAKAPYAAEINELLQMYAKSRELTPRRD